MEIQLNGFSKKDVQDIIDGGIPKDNLIALFDGGYSRIGIIFWWNGKCSVCHKESIVLRIDSSEEEYSTGSICFDCVKLAIFTGE